jgi:diguanylate cyclase (GGDEF)-like protein/putative nucleotidyltransferase with HDIG domain
LGAQEEAKRLTWQAKAYFALLVLGGLSILAELPAYWYSEDILRFIVFTALALLTSGWKVSLPGFTGSLSVHFLFVLVGTAQLSAGETLLMSSLAVAVAQLKGSRANLVQAAFNVASAAIAVRVATLTFGVVTPAFPALQFPFRLALTALTYFLCNTFPVAILIALQEKKSLLSTWRAFFFWSFPFYVAGASLSGLLYAIKLAAGWQTVVLVVPCVYLIYRTYGDYLQRLAAEKQQAEVERNAAQEMSALHMRTIEALALAIEAKDQSTHHHLQRVQIYCTAIGRELGMAQTELDALLAASLLHDIGKLAVPEHILSKPGKLTSEEFEKMKIHTIVGAEILESVRFPYPVVPIVRHHHEKWDGSGYPDGLRAEQIPLGARILSAVDCFDALSSERHYRRALPIEQSIAHLQHESGRSFDPRVVAVIVRRYQELEALALRHTETTRTRPCPGSAPPDRSEFVESIAAARAEAQFLFSLSQDLTLSIDLSTMFHCLAGKLKPAIPYDTIAYYHRDGETLQPLFAHGSEMKLFGSLRIPAGQGLSGWVVQEGKAIRNGNPAVEPGFLNDPSAITIQRSALSVPVEGASGVIGALTLYANARDAYSAEHQRILMAVAARLAFQVENSLRYQKANGDANLDVLTGLPNSRWLVSHLQSGCAAGKPFTVVVMDLDGFKLLNDTFGHLRGNEALRTIAHRCRELLPPGGHMARMGGDEFVITLPDYGTIQAKVFAGRVQSAIEGAGLALIGEGWLSASWGISTYGPDGEAPDLLMAEADRRMYEHKRTKHERMSQRLARLAKAVEDRPAAAAVAPGRTS